MQTQIIGGLGGLSPPNIWHAPSNIIIILDIINVAHSINKIYTFFHLS